MRPTHAHSFLPSTASVHAGVPSGDSMSGGLEALQLLDVDVDHLAGSATLVATGGGRGSISLILLSTRRWRVQRTVDGKMPSSVTIRWPVHRWCYKVSIRRRTYSGVGWRSLCGREDRSHRSAIPSVRKRATHFATSVRPPIHGALARLNYATSIVHPYERSFGPLESWVVAKHQHLQSGPNGQLTGKSQLGHESATRRFGRNG